MDLSDLIKDDLSKFKLIKHLTIKLYIANYWLPAALICSWPRGLVFLILLTLSLSTYNSPETSKIIIWSKFGFALLAFLNWLVDAYFLKKKWLLLNE